MLHPALLPGTTCARSGEVTSTKPLPVPLTLAAFDESGRTAAYVVSSFAGAGSDPGGSEIAVADLPAGTVARVTVQGQVCAKGCVGSGDTPHLAISPDDRWVAVRTGDEVLGLQHTDGTLVRAWSRTLPGPGFVHFVDDTTLQAHDGAAVHTLDAATGEPLAPAAASLLGGRWRVMPDAALVTPGNDCGGVRLVDPKTFGVLARVPVAQTTYETGCDDVDAVWIDGGRAMLLEAQSLCGPGVGPCATVLPADPQGLRRPGVRQYRARADRTGVASVHHRLRPPPHVRGPRGRGRWCGRGCRRSTAIAHRPIT